MSSFLTLLLIRGGWVAPSCAHYVTRPPFARRDASLSPSEGILRPRVAQAQEHPAASHHPRHALSRLHRVVQQHRNRHRSHATRHRTNPTCLLTYRFKINI